ncbi:ketopantoate reductase PanE/ApbA-domain-containing protein [Microdochium bolleyi]|uniref:Ketopantoate reductase PanE/ApbA-domain-containing protein n=1 Tax=Microdochium bolleyi TaxID=196109 RepID=A0A136JBZ7_9PEZI|nr:ketopantoate reductase PanE/ApbA-domain-containing protein [Microdochium bolleyi]
MDQKVLVFGTGSIGTVYAWVVSNTTSPENLVCVLRSSYNAARENGITLNSTIWGQNLNFRPTIVQSVAEVATAFHATTNSNHDGNDKQWDRPFDYIIVASKVLDTSPSTAEILKPVITPGHTAIVLIQNGIHIEDEYAQLYPDNPILSGVVRVPATQTAPAVVEHKQLEELFVGTFPAFLPANSTPSLSDTATPAKEDGKSRSSVAGFAEKSTEAAARFVEMLTRGGATVKLVPDIQAHRWQKLVLNVGWNPVTALSRLRDQHFLRTSSSLAQHESKSHRSSSVSEGWPHSSPSPQELERLDPDFSALGFVRDLMLEVAAVAAAYGYGDVCNAEMVDRLLGMFLAMSPEGIQSSMMADAVQGRSMEVEAIVGNAARLGRAKGVSTPILKTVYMLIRGLDASFRL